MRRVHFINGNKDTWISGEVLRLLHLLYLHPPRTQKEWAQTCCRAGLCPLVLVRTGLTYKAAS